MSVNSKPAKASDSQRPIDRLLDIMAYLRESPDGCPWTKSMTHKALAPYIIEESYETAEMLDLGKHDGPLRDELGDVLLQIVFHAQIARERGAFSFEDVAEAISDKLTRRYPTILGDEPNTLRTPEEIDRRWEEIKAQERAAKGITKTDSILDEVSHALPALQRASKLKGRAAKEGWEWPDANMLLDKIVEETREIQAEIEAATIDKERVAAEIGDLMFMLVDFARYHGIDAEDALRTTNNRFERRFRHMEQGIRKDYARIGDAPRDLRRDLWEEAKKLEKEAPAKN